MMFQVNSSNVPNAKEACEHVFSIALTYMIYQLLSQPSSLYSILQMVLGTFVSTNRQNHNTCMFNKAIHIFMP